MQLIRRKKYVWDAAAHKAALKRDENASVEIIADWIRRGDDPNTILGYQWLKHLVDPLLKGDCEWQKKIIGQKHPENAPLVTGEKEVQIGKQENHAISAKDPVLIRRGESKGKKGGNQVDSKIEEPIHVSGKRSSERPGLW